MIASQTTINGLTGFQRARLLPIDGAVRVLIGQSVNPETVIAEASLAPQVEVLDLRPVVGGISRRELQPMIEREVGERVETGDVIISTGGTLNRVLRATANGIVRAITSEQVILEVFRRPYQLRAAYQGDVVEIIPNRGVILQMRGGLVQGVWGNGQHADGKLAAAAENPAQLLDVAHLRAECVDAIVLAGRVNNLDVLKRAENLPVRGMIVGSISSQLIAAAQQLKFPLMVLNGFGPVGMDAVSYRLLRSNQGRRVALAAFEWNREQGVRPEVFIPLPLDSTPASPPLREFAQGQTVRVNTLPYLGQVGQIARIYAEPVPMPSGVKATAADVLLKTGQRLMVPLLNLDVIE